MFDKESGQVSEHKHPQYEVAIDFGNPAFGVWTAIQPGRMSSIHNH